MDDTNKVTPFDEITQTKEIQILKTMVPYLNPPQQKQIALLIQYLALKHTYTVFSKETPSILSCSIQEPNDRRTEMLSELKKFCNNKEQETIDTILNILYMMENYETFMH